MNSSKKHHEHWFEMTAGPDQGGQRITRYYVVKCKCGRSMSHHAANVSDEKLRKIFIREGWDIGRTTAAHLCPGCKHKKHDKPKAAPTPPQVFFIPPVAPLPVVTIEMAWQGASDRERVAFVQKHRRAFELAFGLPESWWPPEPTPEPAPPPEPEPEPELIEDDGPDEPADWWLDLQKKEAAE